MSYLLDRKVRRARFLKIAAGAIILVILIYFQGPLFRNLSYATGKIFRPVLVLGNRIISKTGSWGVYFHSKGSLYRENESLRQELILRDARLANYGTISKENEDLKAVLGSLPKKENEKENKKENFVLAGILSKPNRSPYDTLLIDAGQEEGIQAGNLVWSGGVPLGRVESVLPRSATVVLFSSPGEKTQVIVPTAVQGAFLEVVGRGGGNFEMVLPRDFALKKGTEAALPGHTPHVVAVTEKILSDPRDPWKVALLRSPINIFELAFVEVELH